MLSKKGSLKYFGIIFGAVGLDILLPGESTGAFLIACFAWYEVIHLQERGDD